MSMQFIAAIAAAALFSLCAAAQPPPTPSGGSAPQDTEREEKEKGPLTGTLIVLNKAEATASFIDLATAAEVARIPTGNGPHEVAVSPDGKTAVVANYGDQQEPGRSLTVIDIASKSVTKTIDLAAFRRPHGVVFLRDPSRVAVTAEANQSLLIVDLAHGKVVQIFSTDAEISHMVAVTPWRPDWPVPHRAYVSNIGSGSVCAFDLDTGKRLGEIVTAPGAEGIDVSPDGREVWVANRAADTISVIDSYSLSVVYSIECASFPIRLKFTPDGSNVLVSNARTGDVAVIDWRTRTEFARIKMDAEPVDDPAGRLFAGAFEGSPVPVGILVHPAGDYAFVANTQADVVTLIDLHNYVIVGRIKAGREPDGLGFSPLELAADEEG